MLALLLACADPEPAETGHDPAACADAAAPEIAHTPVEGPLPLGEDVPVEADVTDDCGVFRVSMWYSVDGDGGWDSKAMVPEGDLFGGSIPGEGQVGPEISYYIEATDKNGNVATAPAEGLEAPYRVDLD
jgi:hypothetical protein